MVGTETFAIYITFLFAIFGYFGLTLTSILITKDKNISLIWIFVSIIIALHVLMVWNFRYSWQFDQATRNGYGGFFLFHSAFILIIISHFFKTKSKFILIHISFVIITIGAISASFRYNVVANYQIPVVVLAISGIFVLSKYYFIKSRLNK